MTRKLLSLCLLAMLAACSTAQQQTVTTDIAAATTTANQVAATAGQYLGDACAVLTIDHNAFQLAEIIDPAIADQKAVELGVWNNLIGAGGICNAATIANPPANAAELIAVAYAQVRVFVKTLPGVPVAPAVTAPNS
jgi:hypothetical protein